MKGLIYLAIYLASLTPLKGDDLLSGYSTVFSSASTIEVKVKPSLERGEIKDSYEYVVFVFINGVNDLGILNASLDDINEMEAVGSTEKVAVVVEHNRIEKGFDGLRFGNGANTYFIRKDPHNSPEIISEVIYHTPDGDMGSARHLAVSAKRIIKRFKPEKFILILWNHGNGYFGISYDDVSGNSMSVKDLSLALSEIKKAYGRKIDIFAMDACLMQMAEVVSELRDYARYIVASEEMIPGAGYPYDEVIKKINNARTIEDAAKGIVDAFYSAYSSDKSWIFGRYYDKDITLSVIDTSKYSQFLSLLNNWVKTALHSDDFRVITSTSVKDDVFFFLGGEIRETIRIGPYLSTETEGVMTRSADLVDYLNRAFLEMRDENLKSKTRKLIDFIKRDLVLYHKGGDFQNRQGFSYQDRTHGLAIYLPKLRYNSAIYEGLRFARESLWDDFLRGDLSDELSYLDGRREDNRPQVILPDEEFSSNSQKTEAANIKIEKDRALISQFGESTLDSQIVSTSELDIKQKTKTSHLPSNSSNTPSPYSNYYSTSYTHKKTILPKEDNLIKGTSGSNPQEIISASEFVNNEAQSSKSKAVFVAIDKSKETFGSIIAKLSAGAKKMKEMIAEDRSKKEEILKLMERYEIEISTRLDIKTALKLYEDTAIQQEFLKVDKKRAERLISYASAIKELDEMLGKDYSDDTNTLNSYLATTLDRSRQICELNICVPPENLVERLMRRNIERYKPHQIIFTEKAIRKWEYVFTDEEIRFDWAQARNIRISSTTWRSMSIKERNAAIERFVKESLIEGNPTQTLINLTPDRLKTVGKRQELSLAVKRVGSELLNTGFLSSDELKAISRRPLEEQAYILANLFDRSGIKGNPAFVRDLAVINANRTSFTNEVLTAKDRAILSNYLSNNIRSELLKSPTALKLYSELYKNGIPSISLEYIGGRESDHKAKQIIINASLIEQYMRIKGYSVESLKDEKVRKEIAAYISPVVVREMGSIYISRHIKDYSPDVREKYALALLYQAQYMAENSRLDEIFSGLYGYVDYADKLDAIRRLYRTSDSHYDFIQKAGLRYYPNLLSATVARSEMLSAVSKELERRTKLSSDERKRLDRYAIFNEKDIARLSPSEIVSHIDSFTTQALLKLEELLVKKDNFASLYDEALLSFRRGR